LIRLLPITGYVSVTLMWLNDLGHVLRVINFLYTKEVSNEIQQNFFSRI